MKYFALIPAAGIGARFQADRPKQYLELDPARASTTIIEKTLQTFIDFPAIEQVMVALRADDPYWPNLLLSTHPKIQTTIGGATRAQSVLNGLFALQDDAADEDWVLVHDAARPFVTTQEITRLLETLKDDPVGGILAVPSTDTLKQVEQGVVQRTVPRQTIWRAQTPQMFRYGLLKTALDSALQAAFEVTDEASAVEFSGKPVKIVAGHPKNIKITTIDDLNE